MYHLRNITHRDRNHLDQVKQLKCLVCGVSPCDPCHVKSRGAGGGDEWWNIFPACRRHHAEQHQIGLVTFSRRYWPVFEWFLNAGWELSGGKWIHPREVGAP